MSIWLNCKCRCCGQIISFEIEKDSRMYGPGYKFTSEYHKNCKYKIEDNEEILADLISTSNKPLEKAVDVISLEDVKGVFKRK